MTIRLQLADGDLRGSSAVVTLVTSQADPAPIATHALKFGNDQDLDGITHGAGTVGSTYLFECKFAVEGQPLNARLRLGASEKGEMEFLEAAILMNN